MRTFIAISIPSDLTQIIADIQNELKNNSDARVNWTRPHQSHLTLKFLGDVNKKEIQNVSTCLEETTSEFSPLQLRITSTGGFPNMRNPRVIWLGVDGGDKLIKLHNRVDRHVSTLGFDQEKNRYRPHLTLGRIKRLDEGSNMMKDLLSIIIPQFEWIAAEICLISSHLTPTGAIYKTLSKSSF